jgi:hypothetical protein
LTDDEQFLERWSRRKTATRPNSDLPSPETDATDAAVPMETSEAPDEIDPEDLPDIDSLDENSDFSAFMRNGVPEALRNRALRKLWQTDPAFNVVDGLLEYGEDFTDIAAIAETVQSVYKVGKGMVDEAGDADEPDEDTDDRDAPSDGTDAAAAQQDAALEEPRKEEVNAMDAADETPREQDGAVSTGTRTKV